VETVRPEILNAWLEVASLGFALASGFIAALWAYSKYILERGLIPPARLWVSCESIGVQGGKHVVQAVLHIENLGSSTLIATDVRLDLRYLNKRDQLKLCTRENLIGRLNFRHSLRGEVAPAPDSIRSESENRGQKASDKIEEREPRGFLLASHDTFVQAGIHQEYTFVTALPEDATFVLVYGSFRYAKRPSVIASAALFLSRRLGLIQFTLSHIEEPHTTAKAVYLSSATMPSEPSEESLLTTDDSEARK